MCPTVHTATSAAPASASGSGALVWAACRDLSGGSGRWGGEGGPLVELDSEEGGQKLAVSTLVSAFDN